MHSFHCPKSAPFGASSRTHPRRAGSHARGDAEVESTESNLDGGAMDGFRLDPQPPSDAAEVGPPAAENAAGEEAELDGHGLLGLARAELLLDPRELRAKPLRLPG